MSRAVDAGPTPEVVSGGALDGITVLDLTQVMAGPYATRMLADLGAVVIKVEQPGGDAWRSSAPMFDGVGGVFAQLNAGKRSIILDLKKPDDVATVRRIAATADVVVENYRPGVLDRLGVGYEALSAINPRLIFCSISGFHPGGALADAPSYAPVMHAQCGFDLAQLSYQDGIDRPANTALMMADILSGGNAVTAILAALVARGRTGQGQRVGTTLLSSMANLMVREVQDALAPPAPRRHLYKPIATRDGFILIMPLSDKQLQALAGVIGLPELLADPRFATTAERVRHWDEMMAPVADWASRLSGDACERALDAAGVPAACYRTVREMIADPRFAEDLGLTAIGESECGVRVTSIPLWMEGTPPRVGALPLLDGEGPRWRDT